MSDLSSAAKDFAAVPDSAEWEQDGYRYRIGKKETGPWSEYQPGRVRRSVIVEVLAGEKWKEARRSNRAKDHRELVAMIQRGKGVRQ